MINPIHLASNLRNIAAVRRAPGNSTESYTASLVLDSLAAALDPSRRPRNDQMIDVVTGVTVY